MSKAKDKEAKEWMDRVAKDLKPRIEGSNIVALVTSTCLGEPHFAMQIGYAILLDKPIILLVDKTTKIPESLVRAAKRIERVDMSDKKDLERASKAIQEFSKEVHNG